MNTFHYLDHSLRTLTLDGEPWFVAPDALRATGRRADVVNDFRKRGLFATDELRVIHKRHTHGVSLSLFRGNEAALTLLNESGLYKLIMRSDKPEARKFQDWATREVLPAIRKTGGYLLNEDAHGPRRTPYVRRPDPAWVAG